MKYGLQKIAYINDEMKTNVYYGLLKLAAVDPSRRRFLLGTASALVGSGQVSPVSVGKKTLIGAGKSLNIAAGLGHEAIPTKLLKATFGLNKHVVDMASARMYRMNRVNGDSKGKALSKVMFARKVRELELNAQKPLMTALDISELKKVKEAANTKVSGVNSFVSAGKNLKDAAKAIFNINTRFNP